MAIKTFSVDEEVYTRFSSFCNEMGVSMSKQVELFMRAQTESDPKTKKEYLEKLDRIRKGKFLLVTDFAAKYGLE